MAQRRPLVLVGGGIQELPSGDTLAAVPVKATGAALRAATNDTDFLTPKSVADAAALVALTDAATIAVDMATGSNFIVTLGGNRTLGAPTGAKPGMSGTILIKQPSTGGPFTLAYNAAWAPFGQTPSLSTAAYSVDLLTWIAEDTGKIRFTLTKGGSDIPPLSVWVLIAAAGGGGGNGYTGGGGGSGELYENANYNLVPGNYSGNAGSGGAGGGGTAGAGANGGNTTFNGLTLNGGGGGACQSGAAGNGGSGGGSGYTSGNPPGTSVKTGGGFGNAGGSFAGGGGGAGSAGSNGSQYATGGAGGSGRVSAISGAGVSYAGGGGGGGDVTGGAPGDGAGAGGANGGNGGNATRMGSGGGGGAGGNGGGNGSGGNGFRGGIIMSVPTVSAGRITNRVNLTVTTSGANTIFTSGAGAFSFTLV